MSAGTELALAVLAVLAFGALLVLLVNALT